jgi:hypothetical protein
MSLKGNLNRPLKGWQAGLVVLAVVVLAGLGYQAYRFVAAAVLDARVHAAMPKVCADAREQRRILIAAIEAYKTNFGSYPPDHVVSRKPLKVDPVTNSLLYELAGVVSDSTNQLFKLANLEAADAKFVKEFFQCSGFKNCGETEAEIKHFLPARQSFPCQLHDDPDVFAVGFQPSSEQFARPEVSWEFNLSTWRYISSSPTNNPGGFDLWLEIKTKRQTVTIGNWKAVE